MSARRRRLRVLIGAYALSPVKGSERGVGWAWVKELARENDLWVLTGDGDRADVERALREDSELGRRVHPVFVRRRRWLWLERIWPPAYLWSYRLWQRRAYDEGRRLHESLRFDLVHQLTYVGFRVPGHLWKLDLPFVWGPIGGLENTPWRLLPALGFRGALHYASRNVLNGLHKRVLGLPRRAFRAARGGIIAATSGIQREIRRVYGEESVVLCEVGPPDLPRIDPSPRRPGEPLRIAWSGLHLPGKALPLLLDALARLDGAIDWRLCVLGEGRLTACWRSRAERLGLTPRTEWTGWVPRDVALRRMGENHLFVVTSLKDLTSTVLLEALSIGLPVICPDHCGFSDVVTPTSGVRIPIRSPGSFVIELAQAIRDLHDDEPRRRRLAEGALARSRDFALPGKARVVASLYRAAVARGSRSR